LPEPNGPLSKSMPPTAIQLANEKFHDSLKQRMKDVPEVRGPSRI